MLTKREQRRSDACDIVVVGAGLVGASVAARLTREGFDTAILEARRVAGGASGRSAGMVLAGLPAHYSWAVSVYGRRRAYQLWALTTGGRDRLVEGARQLGIPVERPGSLALAVDEEEADMLWESAKLLREDGFDASFSLTDPLDRGFQGALHRPGDAMVDAGALTRALLDADDVVVHEGTEVHALEPAGDDIRVWAHGRTVLCSAVVLAVNGYAALVHPYLSASVAPVQGQVFALEVSGEVLHDQPCTFAHGEQFLRPLPDGRVLIGGWDRESLSRGQGNPDDGLERFLSRHFPEADLSRLHRRTEVMGFTPDGLPLLGAVPGLPRVYFAVGFAGRGLSWAFVAAEQLVDTMLNDAELGLLSAERLEVARNDAP
jgi:glycine/D-amino acid oxidase-like deaminating enzyme